jgi:hypothetical protein
MPLRSVLFALSASAGAAFIAIVNTRLYGSPLASGYGDLSDAYALANVMPNLRQYGWWLISSETPLAVAGFLCLAIPARRLWPTREACRALWLFSAYAASVWISYLFYVVWDAWWYLRFLLPAWPMMAIGLASLLAAIYASHSVVWKRAAIVLVAAIGVAGMVQAYRQSAFSMAAGEAKYVEAARVIETISRPDDVIVTWQHSGSIRYYAGRLTLRWDVLAPRWLDFAIAWLQARGHHVYLLLEEPELKPFRDRFTATSSIGRLDWLPMVSFRRGAVRLYDVAHTDRRELPVEQPELRGVRECLVQRPPPVLKETR